MTYTTGVIGFTVQYENLLRSHFVTHKANVWCCSLRNCMSVVPILNVVLLFETLIVQTLSQSSVELNHP